MVSERKYFLNFSAYYPTVFPYTESRAAGFLTHLSYTRLPCSSIFNPSVNVVIIDNSRNHSIFLRYPMGCQLASWPAVKRFKPTIFTSKRHDVMHLATADMPVDSKDITRPMGNSIRTVLSSTKCLLITRLGQVCFIPQLLAVHIQRNFNASMRNISARVIQF